jgi:formate hydrogenlyase subunit 3/multisubunit Na+/H+ antiporter MnhD subunit
VAVGTLLMYVKVQRYALEGERVSAVGGAGVREGPVLMTVALCMLAVICLVAGLAVLPLRDYLFQPAGNVLLKATQALSVGVAP